VVLYKANSLDISSKTPFMVIYPIFYFAFSCHRCIDVKLLFWTTYMFILLMSAHLWLKTSNLHNYRRSRKPFWPSLSRQQFRILLVLFYLTCQMSLWICVLLLFISEDRYTNDCWDQDVRNVFFLSLRGVIVK
jgi:hypothetical protein